MKNTICCSPHTDPCCDGSKRPDWLLWGCGLLIIVFYTIHLSDFAGSETIKSFAAAVFEFMNTMWWGLILGILFVGALNKVPKDIIMNALGDGSRFSGILRATIAGLCFDLCSHGILLVAMKLYERGASLGQTMAFLIASPWNSLSLTIILISLIGLKWTLLFIILSLAIALISGLIFEHLVQKGTLPRNANRPEKTTPKPFWPLLKKEIKKIKWCPTIVRDILRDGAKESGMLLRWIFLGVLLASGLRSFLTIDHFQAFFGPTVAGLGITLVAATVIEVCSEGSAPIASDLLARAKAPGNAFTFLMAGAATDYTEIMGLREATKSWKIALFLPLVTVPQILILGYLINFFR